MSSTANSPDSAPETQGRFARLAFVLFAAVNVIASLVGAISQSVATEEIFTRTVLSVAPLGLLALGAKLIFRLPAYLLLSVVLAFGLYRGVVIYWPVDLAQLAGPAIAAAITALWGVVIFRVVKALEHFDRQFQQLQQSGWDWISSELQHRVSAYAEQEIKSLQNTLLGIITGRATEAVSRDIASKLITENLRNTLGNISSMRLTGAKQTPSTSLGRATLEALRNPRFDLIFVAVSHTALSLVGIMQLVDFWRGVVSVMLSSLVLIAGTQLIQRTGRIFTSAALTFFAIAAVAVGSTLIPDTIFTLAGQGSELDQFRILIVAPLGALVLLIGSAVFSKLNLDRKTLIAEFAIRLSDRELIDLYIHHSLQSELRSISLLYEESAVKDSSSLEDLARERLAEFSSRDLESEFRATLSNPRARLRRVLDSWSPIVEISAAEFLASENSMSSLACRVVEEAISNSVRYGGATKMSISAKRLGSKLRLEILANGGPVEAGTEGGIGRRLLEVASYSWRISPNKDGTALIVTIPFLPEQLAEAAQ